MEVQSRPLDGIGRSILIGVSDVIERTEYANALRRVGYHVHEVSDGTTGANPDANDPAGQTSRFTSADTKLDEWLDAGAEGAVVIQIEGKSYTGKIAHDHDHAGHNY